MNTEFSTATFAVILAAAGKSSRFNDLSNHNGALSDDRSMTLKKPFARLLGKPVWLHSVERFLHRDEVKQILIVVSPEDIDWFRDLFAEEINRYYLVVLTGGAERVDSVRNALNAVRSEIDFVAVHDAARPCISDEEIDQVFDAARQHGSAMLASPITGTIKRARNGQIVETVPREELWEAQTPQVFRRETLFEAYDRPLPDTPTDDAQLVENIGHPVHIVPTDRWNLKITTATDLLLAEKIILCKNKEGERNSERKMDYTNLEG